MICYKKEKNKNCESALKYPVKKRFLTENNVKML